MGYAKLLHALSYKGGDQMWDKDLAEYKRYKDDMTQIDWVVLYKGRIVIPVCYTLRFWVHFNGPTRGPLA